MRSHNLNKQKGVWSNASPHRRGPVKRQLRSLNAGLSQTGPSEWMAMNSGNQSKTPGNNLNSVVKLHPGTWLRAQGMRDEEFRS